MLENWLKPINATVLSKSNYKSYEIGSKALFYKKELPDLQYVKIAFIGLDEDNANAVRERLYGLSFHFPKGSVADLGNVRKNEPGFYTSLLLELLNSNIIPVLIGGSMEDAPGQYLAHQAYHYSVSWAVIDEMIGYYPKARKDNRGYLENVIDNPQSRLFHLSVVGCQSHFTPNEAFSFFDKYAFDYVRLGKAKKQVNELEPIVRDADLMSFDLGTIKQADAPAQERPSPSGFTMEEACQISKYAGLSDKLRSVGFFGFDQMKDINQQTASVVAQLVWYFMDGFFARKNDFPISNDGLTEYLVENSTFGDQLTFWKSNKTGRWWLQIPVETKKKQERHRLVPCSYNDYIEASQDELPERLWNAIKRFG